MAEINSTAKAPANQSTWLTVLRVALGLILFWKAINFIRDTATAKMLIQETGIGYLYEYSEILAFIVGYLGLLCGLFIALGLVTRVASVIQIPVLIVAVFFINVKYIGEDIFEFVLSMITLILLILFAIKGSGPISLDDYFRRGAAQDKRSGNISY